MSPNDSELTFIRCPSCKSLVPAVSTRCRMCGAEFNNTASEEDVGKIDQTPAEENSEPHEPMPEVTMDADYSHTDLLEEDEFEDPLQDYVKEVDESQYADKSHDEEMLTVEEQRFEPIEEHIKETSKKTVRAISESGRKRGGLSFSKEQDKRSVSAETVSDEANIDEQVHLDRQHLEPQKVTKKPEVKPTRHTRALVGWLVENDETRSNAIELREGRFFVTSSRIKDTDLVIDDEDISVPHAIFRVSRDGGLEVLDLMSETGTFVKPYEKSEFVKQIDRVQLKHGDMLKLGKREFIVVLIP